MKGSSTNVAKAYMVTCAGDFHRGVRRVALINHDVGAQKIIPSTALIPNLRFSPNHNIAIEQNNIKKIYFVVSIVSCPSLDDVSA